MIKKSASQCHEMRSLVFLPGNMFSQLDAFIPILVSRSGEYQNIATFFFDKRAYDELQSSVVHYRALEGVSAVYVRKTHGRLPRVVGSFRFFLQFIMYMLRAQMRSCEIDVVFLSKSSSLFSKPKDWLVTKLVEICLVFIDANRVYPPNIQAPLTEQYIKRFSDNVRKAIFQLEGRAFVKYHRHFNDDARYLVFSNEHKKCIEKLGCRSKIDIIGHPKLSEVWKKTVERHLPEEKASSNLSSGLANDEKIITVLLTAPDYVWYPPNSSQNESLCMVIKSIRKYFPDIKIVLKAKPRYADISIGFLQQNNFGYGVLPSTDSLPALASNSIFAISLNETSAVFDFLFAGLTVIEFSNYRQEWLDAFSCLSPWEGVPGFQATSDIFALEGVMRSVKNRACNENIIRELKHYFSPQQTGVS